MKNQPNLFSQKLQPPKSNIQEILHDLITNGSVSIVKYWWQPGFRMRIAEIRFKGIKLDSIEKKGTNKWGRKYKFMVHKLPFSEMENAVNIYKKLQKIKE